MLGLERPVLISEVLKELVSLVGVIGIVKHVVNGCGDELMLKTSLLGLEEFCFLHSHLKLTLNSISFLVVLQDQLNRVIMQVMRVHLLKMQSLHVHFAN